VAAFLITAKPPVLSLYIRVQKESIGVCLSNVVLNQVHRFSIILGFPKTLESRMQRPGIQRNKKNA
jgi:hypothetical protein